MHFIQFTKRESVFKTETGNVINWICSNFQMTLFENFIGSRSSHSLVHFRYAIVILPFFVFMNKNSSDSSARSNWIPEWNDWHYFATMWLRCQLSLAEKKTATIILSILTIIAKLLRFFRDPEQFQLPIKLIRCIPFCLTARKGKYFWMDILKPMFI